MKKLIMLSIVSLVLFYGCNIDETVDLEVVGGNVESVSVEVIEMSVESADNGGDKGEESAEIANGTTQFVNDNTNNTNKEYSDDLLKEKKEFNIKEYINRIQDSNVQINYDVIKINVIEKQGNPKAGNLVTVVFHEETLEFVQSAYAAVSTRSELTYSFYRDYMVVTNTFGFNGLIDIDEVFTSTNIYIYSIDKNTFLLSNGEFLVKSNREQLLEDSVIEREEEFLWEKLYSILEVLTLEVSDDEKQMYVEVDIHDYIDRVKDSSLENNLNIIEMTVYDLSREGGYIVAIFNDDALEYLQLTLDIGTKTFKYTYSLFEEYMLVTKTEVIFLDPLEIKDSRSYNDRPIDNVIQRTFLLGGGDFVEISYVDFWPLSDERMAQEKEDIWERFFEIMEIMNRRGHLKTTWFETEEHQ